MSREVVSSNGDTVLVKGDFVSKYVPSSFDRAMGSFAMKRDGHEERWP